MKKLISFDKIISMKKILFILGISFISLSGFSQVISPEDASKHIGDSVQICGKIFGGRFFETSSNAPTLLNMGAAFPASPLTIMIPGSVRAKLGYAPEQELRDKNICVWGKVVLFKDKPEIIIYDVKQLSITK
jgi:hypothetical protein